LWLVVVVVVLKEEVVAAQEGLELERDCLLQQGQTTQ
jgi:hypothetical protein